MGSTNPLFVLPGAIESKADSMAEGLAKSVLLGVGQFCTCPGLVFGVERPSFQAFTKKLTDLLEQSVPGTMLNAAIARGFEAQFDAAASVPTVEVHRSARPADSKRTEGQPGVIITNAKCWLQNETLHKEIFGPATVVVACSSPAEVLACSQALEGTLTASIHGTPDDLAQNGDLVDVLTRKAGRLIFNGFPTGVEVGYAMHHGGPYPATTDEKFTSVGAASIYRFARPVCYQNFPEQLLPLELQNANSLGIWRNVNGRLTQEAL